MSGTTSARFARLVGVSKQTVDNWRYGRFSYNGHQDDVAEAVERINAELAIALQLGEKISGNLVLTG